MADELQLVLRDAVAALFAAIPVGVGASRAIERLSRKDLARVLRDGAAWAIARGFGERGDLERCEEGGRLDGADVAALSERAIERGLDQVGTLGSGNHFAELDVVEEIYARDLADRFGLFEGQVVMQVHSGSRGLGYQVCDDALREIEGAMRRYGIALPDRQLAAVPVGSPEGLRYRAAMAAAANFAWANRQTMGALAVRALESALGLPRGGARAALVYDVCHNIAKLERHSVNGAERTLFVHRKGATRAFGPGRPELPSAYRDTGQPVLVPGDMGRSSMVLAGTGRAMAETFGSACHGAGRMLSRHEALRRGKGRAIDRELAERGIVVMSRARKTLAEEMSEAYKDVRDVTAVLDGAGIARRVARLRPVGVIKG